MKNCFKILLTLFAGAVAVACVHQDPDFEDCETGIRLLFNWISPAAPREDTSTLQVRITGENATSALPTTSPVAGRELDILPGEYRFTAWEQAANITVDGTVLTLASTPARAAGDPVAAVPQPFTAGTTTDTVENRDGYQEIYVPMYQQTRDLIIRMRFTGNGVPLIGGATGRVDGITLSRDMTFGFPPVDGRIRPQGITSGVVDYTFAQDGDGWYAGRHTLLGIDGDADQLFTVDVHFTDGNTATESLELTAEFNGFHTVDVDQPWVITLVLDIGLNLDLTIVDWYSGGGWWLVAD